MLNKLIVIIIYAEVIDLAPVATNTRVQYKGI